MEFLGFLFTAFSIWILVTVLRIIFKIYRLRRQTRKAFEQFFGAGSQGAGNRGASSRHTAPQQPAPPAKKIDHGIGEYVHFEEIEISAETSTSASNGSSETRTSTTVVEEQIVDAEWEEIS